MNRKIKFRGKRVDNEEWVYGFYSKCIFSKEADTIIVFENSKVFTFDAIPETVGQFVGSFMMYGVSRDVYDGDIVKFKQPYQKEFKTGRVHFDNFGWRVLDCTNHVQDMVVMSVYEVIGNIHEQNL